MTNYRRIDIWTWVLSILTLVFAWTTFDIAWNETLYRLGIYVFPPVLLLAIIVLIITRYLFKKGPQQSLNASLFSLAFLLAFITIAHRIDKYKPTITLTIPDGFEGCVYIFRVEDEEAHDTTASDNGIAYLPYGGHYLVEIEQSGEDITSRLAASGMNEIVFYRKDSLFIRWISVQCFSLTNDSAFNAVGWDYVSYECMDENEFETFVEAGLIDTNGLKFKSYLYTPEERAQMRN